MKKIFLSFIFLLLSITQVLAVNWEKIPDKYTPFMSAYVDRDSVQVINGNIYLIVKSQTGKLPEILTYLKINPVNNMYAKLFYKELESSEDIDTNILKYDFDSEKYAKNVIRPKSAIYYLRNEFCNSECPEFEFTQEGYQQELRYLRIINIDNQGYISGISNKISSSVRDAGIKIRNPIRMMIRIKKDGTLMTYTFENYLKQEKKTAILEAVKECFPYKSFPDKLDLEYIDIELTLISW